MTKNNPRSPKTRKPLNKLQSNQPTSKVDQDVAKTERKLGRNLHSVRASSTQKTVVKGPRFKEEIKTQKCTPGNKTARGAKLSDKAEEPSKKVFRTSSSTATLPTVKPLDKKTIFVPQPEDPEDGRESCSYCHRWFLQDRLEKHEDV